MATIKIVQDVNDSFYFSGNDLDLSINGAETKAVWSDESTGVSITITGEDLAAKQGHPDLLAQGKIDSVTVNDGDGDLILSASKLHLKVSDLTTAYKSDGVEGILLFVTQGDDRVIGSNNSEVIFGGSGNDVLTGKEGSDLFIFQAEQISNADKVRAQYDVITDFDAKGGDADQLSITLDYDVSARDKTDTLLTFDDGSTLLLLDVKTSVFEHYIDHAM